MTCHSYSFLRPFEMRSDTAAVEQSQGRQRSERWQVRMHTVSLVWPKYLLREAFKSHLIIPSLMMEAARLPGHSIYSGRQPSSFLGHNLS